MSPSSWFWSHRTFWRQEGAEALHTARSEIPFITLTFPTSSRGISDTAVASWQAHTEIKGFPVVRGSPADRSPQVRPELCAVNCVTPVNLLNQDQRNVCPILASVKPTKSKAIFH